MRALPNAGGYPLALWYGVGSVTPPFSRGRFERDLRVFREVIVRQAVTDLSICLGISEYL